MRIKIETKKSKKRQIITIIISALVVLAGGFYLYQNTLGSSAPENFITISEKNSVTYEVHYTSDNPTEKPHYEMNLNYVYDLTDFIKITNAYRAELSSGTEIAYDYTATATLIYYQVKAVGSANNPEIDKETFELEKITNSTDSTRHGFASSFRIDPKEYREKILAYQEKTGLRVGGKLRLDFVTTITDGENIKSTNKRAMTIPVTDDVYKIDLTGEENRTTEHNAPSRSQLDTILLAVSGIVIVVGIGVICLSIKKLIAHKSSYREEIDGYLDMYEEAIIRTTTPPEMKNHPEHIAVESLKELLTLAMNTSDPIMYFETPASAFFYIIRDSIFYYFIVDNPDFREPRKPRKKLPKATKITKKAKKLPDAK